jgi:hypothetical protein
MQAYALGLCSHRKPVTPLRWNPQIELSWKPPAWFDACLLADRQDNIQ